MMTYEMFKEIVTEQFLSHMPAEFQDHKVVVEPVNKVNQTLDGLTLISPEQSDYKVSPTIYINHIYEDYLRNESLTEALKNAASHLVVAFRSMPKEQVKLTLEGAKENVVMMLVNTEQNKEMLQDIPHRDFKDLSIIYRYVVDVGKEGVASTLITNSLAKGIGMSEKQLYDAAILNTKRLFPPVVQSMSDVLKEALISGGMPESLAESMIGEMPPEMSMYVISNESKINGAVSMLYETELHALAEKMGDDLYILPSSIHEVIAVPASGGDPEELAQMVEDVNMGQVEIGERLSNQVYHYDKDLRTLTLATDNQNKRLDGIVAVAEAPLIYDAKSR